MELTDKEKYIIEQYEQEEQMMVLIFAQWCVNYDLDPVALYEQAYPAQMKNKSLQDQLTQTVPKNESEEITTEMVLYALQVFGNDDLAFVVQEAADKKRTD